MIYCEAPFLPTTPLTINMACSWEQMMTSPLSSRVQSPTNVQWSPPSSTMRCWNTSPFRPTTNLYANNLSNKKISSELINQKNNQSKTLKFNPKFDTDHEKFELKENNNCFEIAQHNTYFSDKTVKNSSTLRWIESKKNGIKKLLSEEQDSIDKNIDKMNTYNDDPSLRPLNSLQLYNQSNSNNERSTGISSPSETRRDFNLMRNNPHIGQIQHSPMHSSQGYALNPLPGAKMLVDPATGQQYFLPAAQPQHIAYYPVFYNAPLPPNQPIYYQAPPSGYFVAQQPMPASPTHHGSSHPMFFQSHTDHNQIPNNFSVHGGANLSNNVQQNHKYGMNYCNNTNSSSYHVEIPPSNASVSSNFQRNHETRLSTESNTSSPSNSSLNKHFDDVSQVSQNNLDHEFIHRNSQKIDWQNPRYDSTTSSTTSGFISGGAESLPVTDKLNLTARSNSAIEKKNSLKVPFPDSKNFFHHDQNAIINNFTKYNENEQNILKNQSDVSPKHSNLLLMKSNLTQKPIRMDIDFSQPVDTEEMTKHKTTKANVTPATSFIISFDDTGQDNNSKNVEKNLVSEKKNIISLQDAARQAPTGRRLMRRSAPASNKTELIVDNIEHKLNLSSQDPKQYLFSKMFQHSENNTTTDNNFSGNMLVSQVDSNEKRESDLISEAGTYIVENKITKNMVASKIIDSDDETDDGSSLTTVSNQKNMIQTKNFFSQTQLCTSKEKLSFDLKANESTTNSNNNNNNNVLRNKTSPVLGRCSFASDLRKLREEKNLLNATPPSTSKNRFPITKNEIKQNLRPFTSTTTNYLTQQSTSNNLGMSRLCQTSRSLATTFNTTFRTTIRCHSETRGDGGRHSLRSAANNVQNFQDSLRHSLKLGNNNSKTIGLKTQQESPEMLAWLRRKEYDPRKAAAEAKKMHQLKQRLLNLTDNCEMIANCNKKNIENDLTNNLIKTNENEENYLKNRSVSYHNPAANNSPFRQWINKSMGDERSNKSYNNLSHLEEDIEDFSQLSLSGSTNNIKKTVDELTFKCHKSIELIKLCNKNTLSPSVENLLQSVVNFTTESKNNTEYESTENISDRLERLSSAFDAIQKYLEEQSSPSVENNNVLNLIRPRTSFEGGISSTEKILLDISANNNNNNNNNKQSNENNFNESEKDY